MDLQHAASSTRKHTCWTLWLKHRREKCPFIKDLGHLSPGIEFLELLFTGSPSHLFKVRLHGKIYTLKLSHSRFERTAWEKDPVIVECQVYDYLIESKLVGVVGLYCHGWLKIDKAQEHSLEQKLHKTLEWQRRADTAEDPLRGLLLEYIEGCTIDKAYITAAGAQSLRDRLNHLHNMDIAHGDLSPRNIMGSNDGQETFCAAHKARNVSLELLLFRLQKLKRHQGVTFSTAQSEEQAYGRRV
ncbi:hypothetical protein AJ80_01985 [Polytolypa hystricis UAMH7299]|uniref:Protein kinase domain-containing protein n=1 Tax=Polytolypa hystricis (strain UAMH7299) TaxID=1447883 RepID=A0A2B7YSF3_POLH7|nr:hypothetical protein AJ80_01985 [Polytolypa hystricis UAMH7299]